MKKSVVEKTSEHILKLNQELNRQREGQIKKGASSREMACLKHQSQDNLETKSSRQ